MNLIKSFFVFYLILFHIQAFANMANPNIEGTLPTAPFVGQNAEVIRESIYIKIDSFFNIAKYEIEYEINVLKNGEQIPFLFYASDYFDQFTVKVDGFPVEIKNVPHSIQQIEKGRFNDFDFIFKEGYKSKSVLLKKSENFEFYVDIEDMIFFETDLSKGKHLIEVSYKANSWIDRSDWVREYSFRYALSPAKYWKSFGTLDITLDASQFQSHISTNLGESTTGSLDSIANWHFTELPTEILEIKYQPKVNSFAQFLLKLKPMGLAYITGAILMFIHLILIRKYRIKNQTTSFSKVLVLGSLFIPLVFLISEMYFYDLIDIAIGDDASRFHGYTFVILILYPLIAIVYFFLFWFIDSRFKKMYKK